MALFLLTWNPVLFVELEALWGQDGETILRDGSLEDDWSTGSRAGGIEAGDEVMLVRQGGTEASSDQGSHCPQCTSRPTSTRYAEPKGRPSILLMSGGIARWLSMIAYRSKISWLLYQRSRGTRSEARACGCQMGPKESSATFGTPTRERQTVQPASSKATRRGRGMKNCWHSISTCEQARSVTSTRPYRICRRCSDRCRFTHLPLARRRFATRTGLPGSSRTFIRTDLAMKAYRRTAVDSMWPYGSGLATAPTSSTAWRALSWLEQGWRPLRSPMKRSMRRRTRKGACPTGSIEYGNAIRGSGDGKSTR